MLRKSELKELELLNGGVMTGECGVEWVGESFVTMEGMVVDLEDSVDDKPDCC